MEACRAMPGGTTHKNREAAAKEHGVSYGTLSNFQQIEKHAPEVAAEVARGKKTIQEGRREAGLIRPKVTRTEPENRTTLDQIKEEYDEREAMREADSDEAWVEGLPLYSKLSGKQRDIFVRAATNWRRTTEAREEWKAEILEGVKSNQRPDPYSKRHIRALTCGDPADWDLCSAEDNGGCDGTGRLPDLGDKTRVCSECNGDGFLVR